MNVLCDAIHPKLRVYCGLPHGHLTDHVGMIGKIPVVWPNHDHDNELIAKAVLLLAAGVLIAGVVVGFACAAVSAIG